MKKYKVINYFVCVCCVSVCMRMHVCTYLAIAHKKLQKLEACRIAELKDIECQHVFFHRLGERQKRAGKEPQGLQADSREGSKAKELRWFS